MPLQLNYAKNFLGSFETPEAITSSVTTDRVADRFGQVYVSTRALGSQLRVVTEDGVEVGARSFSSMYDDFATAVNDNGEAIPGLTAQRNSHCMIGDGRYILFTCNAIQGPPAQTQYKRFFLLYECVEGAFPTYVNGVWSGITQETVVDTVAFAWNDGTDNDPIVVLGQYDPFVGNPVELVGLVIPSLNDLITANVGPWWQHTSAGHTPYEMPIINFLIPDTGGFDAKDFFAATSNGVQTPQGVRLFKPDGSTKAFWYLTKRGLDMHRSGSGTKNEWVENVVAPVRTTALVSLDLGEVNPLNCAPTGSDDARGINASVADDTDLLQTLLSDDGKLITDPATDGDSFYMNPRILRLNGQQYIVFVLLSFDDVDLESAQPGQDAVQLARIKFYRFDPQSGNFIYDSQAEGVLFDDTDFGGGAGGGWDIRNVDSYLSQNNEFIIVGINDTEAISMQPRHVWWTSFGTFAGGRARRHVKQI